MGSPDFTSCANASKFSVALQALLENGAKTLQVTLGLPTL